VNKETKMLTDKEVLNMNYYKKTSYSGWMGGMRFLIKREQPESAEGEEPKSPIFHVWVWPGPYIFSMTPADKKLTAQFPFTKEGKSQAVAWINEQYESHSDLWPRRKTDE
jgi:hypothetical protein